MKNKKGAKQQNFIKSVTNQVMQGGDKKVSAKDKEFVLV